MQDALKDALIDHPEADFWPVRFEGGMGRAHMVEVNTEYREVIIYTKTG